MPNLKGIAPAYQGMATCNNNRYLRFSWEVSPSSLIFSRTESYSGTSWAPYMKGAEDRVWLEPITTVVEWGADGLSVKLFNDFRHGGYSRTIKNEHLFFTKGIAYRTIGSNFSARAYAAPSVFDMGGASVFPANISETLCMLNSHRAKSILHDFNPTVNFQTYDVDRLPVFSIDAANQIYDVLQSCFDEHEKGSETSPSFVSPRPSCWRQAQIWAQGAVDRPANEPLQPFQPIYDEISPEASFSYAVGVALGRFLPTGGIVHQGTHDVSFAIPAGIFFLDGTLQADEQGDSLQHPAARPLHLAWAEVGRVLDPKSDLRTWLRLKFFDSHNDTYANKPIYWPLSSKEKTFVAWLNIHRFNAQTFKVLLADHLRAALKRIHGELEDLNEARSSADDKSARDLEKRYDKLKLAREELQEFIETVELCAEKGAPPTDARCAPREIDATFQLDWNDGVRVNAAALWPLLEPLWKGTSNAPKAWWKEICQARNGEKDLDWSHVAMRYWPNRVDEKCQTDPSIAFAHGCLWKYHPERAWAWEIKLQDDAGEHFKIAEPPYRGDGGDSEHRNAYLANHGKQALSIVEKEIVRRRGRGKVKRIVPQLCIESGLWSSQPAECWALEDRIIKLQNAPFRLVSDDEHDARSRFESAYPDLAEFRKQVIAVLRDKDLLSEMTK